MSIKEHKGSNSGPTEILMDSLDSYNFLVHSIQVGVFYFLPTNK